MTTTGKHQAGSRRRPKDRSGAAVFGLLLLGFLIWYFVFRDEPQPPTYESQMAALTRAQETLRTLEPFLAEQKRILEERQQLVGKLQSQSEELQKLVAADRAIVTALLEEQQRRYESRVWVERVWSFALGVISSLVATLAFGWFRRTKEDVPE
jgi:hypothetical protein